MALRELGPQFYTLPAEHPLAQLLACNYRWYTPRFSPRDVPCFADVSSVTESPATMRALRDFLVARYRAMGDAGPTHILGFDARGFLFGPMVAAELGVPFVLMRKSDKSAGVLIKSEPYDKEYKEAAPDVMTIRKGSIAAGARVVLVDDVLATGGTALSGLQLVEASGATVLEMVCVLVLLGLRGVEHIHHTANGRYAHVPFVTLVTDEVLTERNCGDLPDYAGPRVVSCSDALEQAHQAA